MAIVVMWALDAILTIYDYFPKGDPARTDVKLQVIYNAPWFRIPYPGRIFHEETLKLICTIAPTISRNLSGIMMQDNGDGLRTVSLPFSAC